MLIPAACLLAQRGADHACPLRSVKDDTCIVEQFVDHLRMVDTE
jgi:hypothetical protein